MPKQRIGYRALMRFLSLCLLLTASLAARAENVLAHRVPVSQPPLESLMRLTDAEVVSDGERWDGPATAIVPPGTVLTWDLGSSQPVSGAAIQADNNDDYLVSFSDDGAVWRTAWKAGAIDGAGLKTRFSTTTLGTTRFIKLEMAGGDGRYSISEFELFSGHQRDSMLMRARWLPQRPLDSSFLNWFAAMAALLAFSSRRLSTPALVGLAAVGISITAHLVFQLVPQTPGATASLPWARAAVALVAAAAVLREWLWPQRWPAPPGFTLGTLGLTATMGMWCFLNMGMPQFYDAGQKQGSWLHHYDMRTYYPIAKYFPELRFDGVYAASVAAVADGQNLDNFTRQPLRDLRTHAMTSVGESKAHILEVRARFSPERWVTFLEDTTYFRNAMGDKGFLGSMNDHGGNATPVWFLSARALFASAPASDATLWNGVIADIFLLVLAFSALGWAFGPRAALLAMTIFGAMDFYQFGSNWFGATLRHDWLSLWAIGLSLLKKEKFVWAGTAFAWSAWIRAFPALTLVTLTFPGIWAAQQLLRERRRKEAWVALKPLARIAFGVAAASAVLVAVSTSVFGAEAWVEWLRKVQILDRDNHLNNISFRTYISTDKTVWVLACLGSIVALFVALRKASWTNAAAWGIALIPLVFNPANYYLHSAFLLVTLASGHSKRTLFVWLALLAMCVGSLFTTLSTDTARHFQLETLLFFVTLGVLWVTELTSPQEAAPS